MTYFISTNIFTVRIYKFTIYSDDFWENNTKLLMFSFLFAILSRKHSMKCLYHDNSINLHKEHKNVFYIGNRHFDTPIKINYNNYCQKNHSCFKQRYIKREP